MANHSHTDGLLAVNKPAGIVSKDVSRWLVKRLGKVKLGHVGTLDPAASGVLPILLGRATRLQDYLLDLPKTYEFDIAFGSETDTLDQDGTIVREAPWDHITESELRAAIEHFIGDFDQTPPIFSAVKYKGKPLYDYARGGEGQAESVPLEALKRRVRVTSFELLDFKPGTGRFRLTCSKGTYVRSLVKDVAEKVGSCGTLTRLVRTSAAGVDLTKSLDLEQIEAQLSDFSAMVVPIEDIDLGLARWQCPRPDLTARLRGGQQAVIEASEYVDGIRMGDDRTPPGGWAKPVLLLSDKGKAFGIGAVRRQESGRVAVVMRRGLS